MLRVTGGFLRGRRFATPKGRATRPTQEKVREALFSALAHLTGLEDVVVWDLFAGSGALGIEALSRGAARAVFVESHRRTAEGIRENLKVLGLPPDVWRVVTARAEPWLSKGGEGEAPAAVLLDPPYDPATATKALEAIASAGCIPHGCLVAMECAARWAPPDLANLELLRAKRYGDSQILILKKSQAPDQGL